MDTGEISTVIAEMAALATQWEQESATYRDRAGNVLPGVWEAYDELRATRGNDALMKLSEWAARLNRLLVNDNDRFGMPTFTVTVAGGERHDGEKGFTYVLYAPNLPTAQEWMRARHIRDYEEEIDPVTREPRDPDVITVRHETFAGAPDWPEDTAGKAWNDMRGDQELVAMALGACQIEVLGYGELRVGRKVFFTERPGAPTLSGTVFKVETDKVSIWVKDSNYGTTLAPADRGFLTAITREHVESGGVWRRKPQKRPVAR